MFFEQQYETFHLDFYFILSKNFYSGFLLFLTPHWHLNIYFAFFLIKRSLCSECLILWTEHHGYTVFYRPHLLLICLFHLNQDILKMSK